MVDRRLVDDGGGGTRLTFANGNDSGTVILGGGTRVVSENGEWRGKVRENDKDFREIGVGEEMQE